MTRKAIEKESRKNNRDSQHVGGELMKANRQKLTLTMARACVNTADLQKATGMPMPTVKNVMTGRSVLPATIGKVAKALGVDVTEILEDQEG